MLINCNCAKYFYFVDDLKTCHYVGCFTPYLSDVLKTKQSTRQRK